MLAPVIPKVSLLPLLALTFSETSSLKYLAMYHFRPLKQKLGTIVSVKAYFSSLFGIRLFQHATRFLRPVLVLLNCNFLFSKISGFCLQLSAKLNCL